jgi:PAS domain S-box-containing protein
MVGEDCLQTQEGGAFTQHMETVHQRAETLYESARDLPWQQPQLIIDTLEELRLALEELHVAEEDLRLQNEQLISMQQALEAEQCRYKDLFEFAPDAYLVTDVYGVIQEANSAAATLLGLKASLLVGKPLASFLPEDQRCAFRAMLNLLPTINRVQERELTLRRRDQTNFEAALTVATMRSSLGSVTGLRWLVRDITERKQGEVQLRQVQLQNLQLIEADRLKNQFLATISHELRTPLSAILGFAHLLLRRLSAHADPQISHMLERIYCNGKHLLSLIEEMLDFARLKHQGPELRLQSFDLVDLLLITVEELRPLASPKRLELNLQTHPLTCVVQNDHQRLRQIVVNLVSNAIKFTERGQVTLELWELPEGRIALLVRDTGIGIAPEDQAQIFQEFWQVNQKNSRPYGGTGLGLAIVRSLVQSMGGTVSVSSSLGEGATFRVEIPRMVQPPAHGDADGSRP